MYVNNIASTEVHIIGFKKWNSAVWNVFFKNNIKFSKETLDNITKKLKIII